MFCNQNNHIIFFNKALNNKRDNFIDSLKGYAILLVVVGHAIQYVSITNADNIFLFRLIYSFHMPLFMFISGYMAFTTFDGSAVKLNKKFTRLLVPFFSWTAINYLVMSFQSKNTLDSLTFIVNIVKSPDNGGLWFLWVLYLAYFLLFISKQLHEDTALMIILIVLQSTSVILPNINILGLGLLRWHLVFFLTGYYLNKYAFIFMKYALIFGKLSFFIFPVLVFFWNRTTEPSFFVLFSFHNTILLKVFTLIYNYAVSFSGIAFSVSILRLPYISIDYVKLHFSNFGSYSLEIYATHLPFIFIFVAVLDRSSLPQVLMIRILPTLVLTLFATTLCIAAFKKIPVLDRLLYGK